MLARLEQPFKLAPKFVANVGFPPTAAARNVAAARNAAIPPRAVKVSRSQRMPATMNNGCFSCPTLLPPARANRAARGASPTCRPAASGAHDRPSPTRLSRRPCRRLAQTAQPRPRDTADLAMREAGQARSGFAAIEDGLEFIMAQISRCRRAESSPGWRPDPSSAAPCLRLW
jgi:hypothetical protein